MIYEIGDFIEEYNLDVLDKKKDKNSKTKYKYGCRKCGFSCGEHYIGGIKKTENWVVDIKGCGCCNSYLCVTGINDLATTDPWMVPYFVDENEPFIFKANSNQKTLIKCIYCGKEKMHRINQLHKDKKLSCECHDNFSFPNKFSYYMFMQLKETLDYYEREFSPEWAERYHYDNYFEYKGQKYILEMDGGLGHGNKEWGKGSKKDTKGLERDNIKDFLAKEHNIILIRVDATISSEEYLKNNLINAVGEILNLQDIDWSKIAEASYSNEIKNICDYYNRNLYDNEKYDLIRQMTKFFNFHETTIKRYLKIGTKFGWTTYFSEKELKKQKVELVSKIKKENPEYSTKQISNLTGINVIYVRKYLNDGNKLGLCEYNGFQELSNSRKSITYVYKIKTMELLKTYDSILQCCEKSLEDFGVQFIEKYVSRVCTKYGGSKSHKGYFFSHELLETI